GYDPVFFLPEYKKTTAQLKPSLKNKISHRYKALSKLKKFLKNYLELTS
ncbi:MAG TPA: non-canonical purine NTP pyrophosphatase, partial [Candidatus Omnitrophica bacterium]|nr:non-canonical purine NTP pyrophosphatase [Candidatus Omnitrophota bacterium]